MLKKDLRKILRKAEDRLHAAGVPEAEADVWILAEYVFSLTRTDYCLEPVIDMDEDTEKRFWKLISYREKRIPVQYIIGRTEFMGLTFQVNNSVLIPRQDTEILVETVLRNIKKGAYVLDMCTGSGCIIISVKHYNEECICAGSDMSEDALKIAKENAELNNTDIKFIHSDLFENIEGHFDIIVSNPPYIKSRTVDTLMPEVRNHEPRMALDGEEDGLAFYRKICEKACNYLREDGMLFFEIGFDQGDEVSELMRNKGFSEVRVIKDYSGLDRVVFGKAVRR